MKQKILISTGILFILLITINSCSTIEAYTPAAPPPYMFFPKSVNVDVIVPPPLLVKANTRKTLSGTITQYFQIAVPPCVDMTGSADYLRTSLADKFMTALFETKRFILLDREEMNAILYDKQRIFKTLASSIGDSTDGESKIIEQLSEDDFNRMDENEIYQYALNNLREKTDGLMLVYITSDKKSMSGITGQVGIDYRIVNKEKYVIFAGTRLIKYNYNENTKSLSFNQNDINDVAKNIKQKFPNPDIQENLKIINIRNDIITVNAGKKANIFPGMYGFVIQKDVDSFGNKLISYRAVFVVKEVFTDNFNAEFTGKDNNPYIIKTIVVGEPVKMK